MLFFPSSFSHKALKSALAPTGLVFFKSSYFEIVRSLNLILRIDTGMLLGSFIIRPYSSPSRDPLVICDWLFKLVDYIVAAASYVAMILPF